MYHEELAPPLLRERRNQLIDELLRRVEPILVDHTIVEDAQRRHRRPRAA